MTVMKWVLCIVPILEFVGRARGQAVVQIQVQPQIVGRSIRDGQVTTVFLAPRYVTAIRMPEPINSVVVGDPSSFSAEHSDREPQPGVRKTGSSKKPAGLCPIHGLWMSFANGRGVRV